jgi:hypothetical protein
LEPTDIAPPPNELSDLQFGGMYEWYVAEMRELKDCDLAERLRDLESLKRKGLINGRDFARERKKVLSQIGSRYLHRRPD